MKQNQKPVTLITGASSGIGLQYARLLAAQGHDLVLVSIEEQRMTEICFGLEQEYCIRAYPVYMNLARVEAAEELYRYCVRNEWDIEILINNAGVFFFNDLTETSPETITRMILLHMQTTTLLCRYFGKSMKERGGGYILNMASMASWMPFAGISVYAASKSYLKKMSSAIHDELYDYHVSVTAVCPGAVATDLYNLSPGYQKLAVRLGIMMQPERLAKKALKGMYARRRCVVPGKINYLFIFLVSLVPGAFVRYVKRKASFYRYGK